MRLFDRILTVLFFAAAPVARFFELRNNLDAEGLPIGGIPYLPIVLLLAAVVFALRARSLPAADRVTASFAKLFRFDNDASLAAAVCGAMLLLAAALLRFVFGGMAGLDLILAVFLALSGASLFYVLFSLRRTSDFAAVALLVPVCYLVVQVIVTYRANARESVLLYFYVALLALAALCLAALSLAAFAYRSGAPRRFVPMSQLSIVLLGALSVDLALAHDLADLLAAVGAALLLAAFLKAGGDFEG